MKKTLFIAAACLLCMPSFGQKISSTTITREKTRNVSSGTEWFDPHYQGEFNIGFGTGGKLKYENEKDDAKFARPFFETVHGVRFNKYMYAGLGLGFQYAYDENWKAGFMPVFLDLKGYYPVTESFAPYIAIDLGYGIGVVGTDLGEGEKLKGGFYAAYGIGLNYRKLNFGLGWQHQSMKFSYEGEESDTFGVNSFYVKVGLKF